MWSSVSGIAKELTAAKATLLEERAHWPDKEDQADGYLHCALFHLAGFLVKREPAFVPDATLRNIGNSEDVHLHEPNGRLRARQPMQ